MMFKKAKKGGSKKRGMIRGGGPRGHEQTSRKRKRHNKKGHAMSNATTTLQSLDLDDFSDRISTLICRLDNITTVLGGIMTTQGTMSDRAMPVERRRQRRLRSRTRHLSRCHPTRASLMPQSQTTLPRGMALLKMMAT